MYYSRFLLWWTPRICSQQATIPAIIDKTLEDSIPIATNHDNISNEYYQPNLRQVLEKKWLGMLPFWSEIMYSKLKLHKYTYFFFYHFISTLHYSMCYCYLPCNASCSTARNAGFVLYIVYIYSMWFDACTTCTSNTGTIHKLMANTKVETVSWLKFHFYDVYIQSYARVIVLFI